MLTQLYKDTHTHIKLKSLVEKRLTGVGITVSSPALVSSAIAKHAIDYALGNRAIECDLKQKLLVNNLRDRLQGCLLPSDIDASITLIERINSNLISTLRPSNQLQQLFYMFTLAWFQVCALETSKALDSKSPGFELLKLVIYLTRRIDQFSGKHARDFCQGLFEQFLEFSKNEQDLTTFKLLQEDVRKTHDKFLQVRKKELKRSVTFLKEKEAKFKAREVVNIKLHEMLGRGSVATPLAETIHRYLKLYLVEQWREGRNFDQGSLECLQDIHCVHRALSIIPCADYLSYYENKVIPALERLRRKLNNRFESDRLWASHLKYIEEILESKKTGKKILVNEVPVNSILKGHDLTNSVKDKWYSKNTKSGFWFKLKIGGKDVCCQVLNDNTFASKVVFVNYSGHILKVFDTLVSGFSLNSIHTTPLSKLEDFGSFFKRVEYEVDNEISEFNCCYADSIDAIEKESMELPSKLVRFERKATCKSSETTGKSLDATDTVDDEYNEKLASLISTQRKKRRGFA